MPAVIELDGLEVWLGGRPVLKGLTGAFDGRSMGLLGPNGAGKSTLLNTLLGFHTLKCGSARILGWDVSRNIRRLKSVTGYMPEDDSFLAQMSAVRFVRLMAELSGLPREEALERTHEALHYVGLGEARYRLLGTYSSGMKQLVKLAQAIAHGPQLLFLDEPTNGLDPPARQRMIRLIREIRDTGRIRLVISSHLLRDIEECCDQVVILKEGRLVASCHLEEERRTNRKWLEVETAGGNSSFEQAVRSLGCQCQPARRGCLKVMLPEGCGVDALYRVAAECQVQIRKLAYRRDSLEDIFLKAMEVPEAIHGRL